MDELVDEVEKVSIGILTEKLFRHLKLKMREYPQFTHVDEYWLRAATSLRHRYLTECCERLELLAGKSSVPSFAKPLSALTRRQWEEAEKRWSGTSSVPQSSSAPDRVRTAVCNLEEISRGSIPRDLFVHIQRKMLPQSRTIDQDWLACASAYRDGFLAKQVELLYDEGARNLSHLCSTKLPPISLEQWADAQERHKSYEGLASRCSCGNPLVLTESKLEGSCLECRLKSSSASKAPEPQPVASVHGWCSNCTSEFVLPGSGRLGRCTQCGSCLIQSAFVEPPSENRARCACGNELILESSVKKGKCWECQLLGSKPLRRDRPDNNLEGFDFWSNPPTPVSKVSSALPWDCSTALEHYVNYRCDRSDEKLPDMDEIVADFLSWPEEFQRSWQNGPPSEAVAATPTFKKIVHRDYYEAVQTLLCLAESPSSKFLDLAALHVNTLLKLDPQNSHLQQLLKAIYWTGTQPGGPFDRHSEKILRDWLKELTPK